MATTETTEQTTNMTDVPDAPTRDDVWKFAAKLSDEDLDAFLKEASIGQAIAADMEKNGRAWLDNKLGVVPTDKNEKDEKDEKKPDDAKPDEKPDDAKPDQARPPSRAGAEPPNLKRSCSVVVGEVGTDEAAAKAAKTEEPPTPRPVSSVA